MTGSDQAARARLATLIDACLRIACTWPDNADTTDGVDMSAGAVTHRIMELTEMSSLCSELGAVIPALRDRSS